MASRRPASPAAPLAVDGRGAVDGHGADALALAIPPALVDVLAERVADLLAEREARVQLGDPWLDVDAAAEYLCCKPKRIYDLCSQGRLVAYKDGSRSLFRRSTLDAYLEPAA